MKKAILISFFLFLLYGFGQIAKASYDDGAGLDYVPPSQSFGIHTMTVPEALTLNGNFALKDQAAAPSNTVGYGKLYNNNGDLYYQNGSSVFLVNNMSLLASSIVADSLDFSEFKDAMTLDASTTIDMDTNSADLNFDSNTLYIDNGGSVGIGTASPGSTLSVKGGVSIGTSVAAYGADAGAGLLVQGTVGLGIYTPSSAYKLDIYNATLSGMRIQAGDNDIILGAYDSSSNLRMVVQSAGNIGIGDSSPDLILDIQSSASQDGIFIDNTAADGDPILGFRLSGVSKFTMGVDDGDSDKFKIGTDTIGNGTMLTINSSGNIGIGDTSPAAKLQVNGDILMGDSSATCDGTTEGSQRYNSTDKRMEFCDGTSWRDFASSGKPSFFHAHRNGTDLTTLTQNTDYTIDWTTEAYDYNSEFDLSTEKFTPTSEGIYLIVLKTRVLAVDADSFAIAKINLNGTTVAHNVETIGSSSVAASVTAVYLVHMNGTTDYVTGVVRHNSSSTKDLSGLATDTYMMGFRVMD